MNSILGGTNAYDPDGGYARIARSYSDLFRVPAEFVAAALNYENHPDKLPNGAFTRDVKRRLTPFLNRINPGHDLGLGYSVGIANVMPGTARLIEAHFLKFYGPETLEFQFVTEMVMLRESGDNNSPEDVHGVAYTVLNLRMGIDNVYGAGYTGPIGKTIAGFIIAFHNNPTDAAARVGSWPTAGEYGIALLIDASEKHTPLPFYQPKVK